MSAHARGKGGGSVSGGAATSYKSEVAKALEGRLGLSIGVPEDHVQREFEKFCGLHDLALAQAPRWLAAKAAHHQTGIAELHMLFGRSKQISPPPGEQGFYNNYICRCGYI